MENIIDVTGVDLVKFVQEVYNLSKPQGMGLIHFTPEPLSDSDAAQVIEQSTNNDSIELSLDYVKGRACKMVIFKDGDKRYIQDTWFDHGSGLLEQLLKNIGCPSNNSTD